MCQSTRVPIVLATIVDGICAEPSVSSLYESTQQIRNYAPSSFAWNANVRSYPVISSSRGSATSTGVIERNDSGPGCMDFLQYANARTPNSALMVGSSMYGQSVGFCPPPSFAGPGFVNPVGHNLPNLTLPALSPWPGLTPWIPRPHPNSQTLLVPQGEAFRAEQVLGHGEIPTFGPSDSNIPG